jgi:hypothetical protein
MYSLLLAVFGTAVAFWLGNSTSAMPLNYSCPFAVVHWNCLDFTMLYSDRRGRYCAGLRFVPDDVQDFFRVDPVEIIRLYNGSTIFFDGDSVTMQHFVEFSCRFVPFLDGTAYLNRVATKLWCNLQNLCHDDHTYGPLISADGNFTYRSWRIRITMRNTAYGVHNSMLLRSLGEVKSGDVIFANHGLHHDEESLLGSLKAILPEIAKARSRGVIFFWRETTASHFAACEGGDYCSRAMDLQSNFSAECADSTALNASAAWLSSRNARVNLLMQGMFVGLLVRDKRGRRKRHSRFTGMEGDV